MTAASDGSAMWIAIPVGDQLRSRPVPVPATIQHRLAVHTRRPVGGIVRQREAVTAAYQAFSAAVCASNRSTIKLTSCAARRDLGCWGETVARPPISPAGRCHRPNPASDAPTRLAAIMSRRLARSLACAYASTSSVRPRNRRRTDVRQRGDLAQDIGIADQFQGHVSLVFYLFQRQRRDGNRHTAAGDKMAVPGSDVKTASRICSALDVDPLDARGSRQRHRAGHQVTDAPSATSAAASANPILPELRLPRKRTGSSASRVGPAVNNTRLPARRPPARFAPRASWISAGSSILPGPTSPQACAPRPDRGKMTPRLTAVARHWPGRRMSPHRLVHRRRHHQRRAVVARHNVDSRSRPCPRPARENPQSPAR